MILNNKNGNTNFKIKLSNPINETSYGKKLSYEQQLAIKELHFKRFPVDKIARWLRIRKEVIIIFLENEGLISNGKRNKRVH